MNEYSYECPDCNVVLDGPTLDALLATFLRTEWPARRGEIEPLLLAFERKAVRRFEKSDLVDARLTRALLARVVVHDHGERLEVVWRGGHRDWLNVPPEARS